MLHVAVNQPLLSKLFLSFHNKIFGGFWHFLCFKVEQILLKRARLEACSAKVSTWRRKTLSSPERKVSKMRKKSSWYIPKSTFVLKKERNDSDDWKVEVQIFWENIFLWLISFLLVTYKNDFSSKLTLDLFHGSSLYCSLVGVIESI